MIEYIKKNKILLSVIVLLLVAGIYVGMLACTQHNNDTNTSTSDGAAIIITNSPGSSGTGNVTNNEPVQIIREIVPSEEIDIPNNSTPAPTKVIA
jgi:hypothetical protein